MMEKPSILVVDDELLIRDLLYDFFTGQGWNISIAESGEKALEILTRLQSSLQEVPVDTAVTALRHKVEDYIIKPFNINKLYKLIESKLFDKRRE